MKIELLSITNAEHGSVKSVMQTICGRISDAVGVDVGGLKIFESPKAFFGEMSGAFSRCDVIIAAAGLDVFLEQKWTLLKALGLPGELNEVIVSEIAASGKKLDNPEQKAQALMPEGAAVFLTADALYSGFAVVSGKQTLIFMPIDEGLAADMLDSGIVPFLIKAAEQGSRSKKKKDSLIAASDLLAKKEMTVSIASTQTSVFARQRTEADERLSEMYKYVECDEPKNNSETLKDYVARLADKARTDGGTQLGAIISNVYSSNGSAGKLFVYIAVSDREHAHVKKVMSKEGETANELVEAATSMLFSMLREYVKTDGEPPADTEISEIPGVEDAEDEQAPPQKKSTALKVLIGIAIALIMCLLIGFFFRDVRALFFDDSKAVMESASETESFSFDEPESELMLALDDSSGFLSETETDTADKNDETVKVSDDEETATTAAGTTKEPETTTKATTTSTAAKTTTTTTTTTTKKVTTTKEETEKAKEDETTKSQTTTKAATTTTKTSETESDDDESKGVFTFTAYGYGHGVGMSQSGALKLGNSSGSYGWTYDQILYHYFPGTTLKTDSSVPALINFNGSYVPTRTLLARVTNAEIGGSCKDATVEGVKAQIVAIYTYLKYHMDSGDNNFATGDVAYKTSEPSSLIYDAIDAVMGQYLDYNGNAAFTPFSSSCAGKSSSATGTWGGKSYPYLSGGVSSPEEVCVRTVTVTSDQLLEYVKEYNGSLSDSNYKITLSGDPSTWIKIISHDSAYNGSVGYVSKIRVGDQEIRGNTFRRMVGYSTLRSHCFNMSYTSAD